MGVNPRNVRVGWIVEILFSVRALVTLTSVVTITQIVLEITTELKQNCLVWCKLIVWCKLKSHMYPQFGFPFLHAQIRGDGLGFSHPCFTLVAGLQNFAQEPVIALKSRYCFRFWRSHLTKPFRFVAWPIVNLRRYFEANWFIVITVKRKKMYANRCRSRKYKDSAITKCLLLTQSRL